MKPFLDMFKAVAKINENSVGFSNYLSRRSKLSFQVEVEWQRPPKYRPYDPINSGDLEQLPDLEKSAPYGLFKKSKEIETADSKVQRIFSLKYQVPIKRLQYYRNELIEKVKNHPYDNTSIEVQIASLTGTIRFLTKQIQEAKNRIKRAPLIKRYLKCNDVRQELLEKLREEDYKKFEWLLEELNIAYRPIVPLEEQERTRKKSLVKLVQLKHEKIKEENLANLKKSLDEQKTPFLEKKMQILKWIKEMEEKHNFPKTVSDADIETCVKRLEEVKIEIEKKMKWGYKRKIHPYTIEPYYEKLLKEKEKAGELIREPEPGS